MFSHVIVGANDLEASKQFYDATLSALGHGEPVQDPKGRYFYRTADGLFGITRPIDGEAASHGNGMTIGFRAESQEQVDAWHAAGLANGGQNCEDPPGIRTGTGRELYLAYLRDPAGNKLCALYRVR